MNTLIGAVTCRFRIWDRAGSASTMRQLVGPSMGASVAALDRMRNILVSISLMASACGSDQSADPTEPDASDPSGDAGSGSDGSSGADGSGGSDGSLSDLLDSCTTSIAGNAPAFYQKYFLCSTITAAANGTVTIQTKDLPPHLSYYYGAGHPNYVAFDTRGGTHHPNPNVLSEQTVRISIPANPTPKGITIDPAMVDGVAGTSNLEFAGGAVGVALDSVAVFSGLAAPGDDIADERFTFDSYEAHPTGFGAYHYHSPTPGPLEVLTKKGISGVEAYGIMCDGTVVLGCSELDGSAPSGSLDAQGGHLGNLVDEAGTTHFTNRYHVHVCATGHGYTPEIQYYTTCTRN